MKKTLEQLGLQYQEQGDRLSISRNYHNIDIDTNSGNISYDDMDKRQVDTIKQEYQFNFWKNEAIKEGMNLQVEKKANGTVLLHLTH